jgi:hypothetical protein
MSRCCCFRFPYIRTSSSDTDDHREDGTQKKGKEATIVHQATREIGQTQFQKGVDELLKQVQDEIHLEQMEALEMNPRRGSVRFSSHAQVELL